MRRRLQESFHLSPSNGGLIHNAGLLTTAAAATQIPTISVSVQTEPAMLSASGLMANGNLTTTMLANGNTYSNVVSGNNDGGVAVSSGGSGSSNSTAAAIMSLQHHSATLPHPSAAMAAASHVNRGEHGGRYMLSNNDILDDPSNAMPGANAAVGVVGSHHHHHHHPHTINHQWSRDNLLARSYRDVRDVVAANMAITHSRDNTLSRDIHHITVKTSKVSIKR